MYRHKYPFTRQEIIQHPHSKHQKPKLPNDCVSKHPHQRKNKCLYIMFKATIADVEHSNKGLNFAGKMTCHKAAVQTLCLSMLVFMHQQLPARSFQNLLTRITSKADHIVPEYDKGLSYAQRIPLTYRYPSML